MASTTALSEMTRAMKLERFVIAAASCLVFSSTSEEDNVSERANAASSCVFCVSFFSAMHAILVASVFASSRDFSVLFAMARRSGRI